MKIIISYNASNIEWCNFLTSVFMLLHSIRFRVRVWVRVSVRGSVRVRVRASKSNAVTYLFA
jgi:hypothetical protein